MVDIDGARLLADLRHLATFGRFGTGVDRPAYSDADIAAREWLRGRMEEAGLSAAIDGVGNVYGRADGAAHAILIGSHSDSVPEGGWLDGALGVVYGIEIARAVREAGLAGAASVDVISFQEEEGAYLPLLGSRAFCGEVADDEIAAAANAEGRTLSAALAERGLAGRPRARLDPARHVAFFEAHIEQGPRLEASGTDVGVVSALVGVRRFRIAISGQADHAGTTPMAMRRDAGAALVRLAGEILDMLEAEGGPDTVWNIGKAGFAPGAFNVVPRQAEFLLELRDIAAARLDALEARVRALAADADAALPVDIAVHEAGGIAPAVMDGALQSALSEAAARAGASSVTLQSGAGHDAMVLSRHVPAGMLFIPSIGGRSHDIAENTADEDIVRGCRVLAGAVGALLAARAAC